MSGSHYLIAALAPASSSFFLMVSASAFGMPSLTVEGAPSTRSFASFRPKPVISRMTLMTPTLLAPRLGDRHGELGLRLGRRRAAAAAPPARRRTATGAAAVTLNFFSMSADQLDHFHDGHLGNRIEDFIFRNSHVLSPEKIIKCLATRIRLVISSSRRAALSSLRDGSERSHQLGVGGRPGCQQFRVGPWEHPEFRQRLRAGGQEATRVDRLSLEHLSAERHERRHQLVIVLRQTP